VQVATQRPHGCREQIDGRGHLRCSRVADGGAAHVTSEHAGIARGVVDLVERFVIAARSGTPL
jgi:hypothetical protein